MPRPAQLVDRPAIQKTPTQLERLSKQAQQSADSRGAILAIYNLNRIGAAMYVIRLYEPKATDHVAGPFYPNN